MADQGYDPVYGARPLKRVMQRRIENPLATYLLEKETIEGAVIRVDFQTDSFVIEILEGDRLESNLQENGDPAVST